MSGRVRSKNWLLNLAISRSWATLSRDIPVKWERQKLSIPGTTTWRPSLLISLPGGTFASGLFPTSLFSHDHHTGPTICWCHIFMTGSLHSQTPNDLSCPMSHSQHLPPCAWDLPQETVPQTLLLEPYSVLRLFLALILFCSPGSMYNPLRDAVTSLPILALPLISLVTWSKALSYSVSQCLKHWNEVVWPRWFWEPFYLEYSLFLGTGV